MNKKSIKTYSWFIAGFALAASASIWMGHNAKTDTQSTEIGIVNFKECIDTSKLGKQEHARFSDLKTQMEKSLEAKQKELNEMAPKFNDEYMDTLTPEAEKDLKEKFKNLSQEFSQQQNHYYQLLNQTNYQIVQKMNDLITKAAEKVAQAKNLKIILNDEACFFKSSTLDISKDVIAELDALFAKEGAKSSVPQLNQQDVEQK
jgi:outer membrane protein